MPLPAYVRHDDGKLEPFDADRLYRRLFAAAEAAGYADPLAARELTDAVLHFIALENDGLIVAFAELESRVATVLRELRHAPVLAALGAPAVMADQADAWRFAPLRPLTAAELARPSYCRYGRALARAEELGLLLLDSVGQADGLAAVVKRLPPRGTGGLEFIEELRGYVTGMVALDAPDLDACLNSWTVPEALGFFEEVAWAAAIHGLTVELHLGAVREPAWSELTPGPLFSNHVDPADLAHRAALRQALLDLVLESAARLWSGLKLVWHVQPGAEANAPLLLLRLARAMLRGRPVEFVLDQRNDDVRLAAGTSRRRPALLQTITLDLATLWARQRPPLSWERFAGKCASLARLAASAASRKRMRLRRELPAQAGYHVEQGRCALRLAGLSEVLGVQTPTARWRSLGRRMKTALRDEAELRSLELIALLEVDDPTFCANWFGPVSLALRPNEWDAATVVARTLQPLCCLDRLTLAAEA